MGINGLDMDEMIDDGFCEKALARAMRVCSRTEKCSAQMRQYLLKLSPSGGKDRKVQNQRHLCAEEVESILQRLIDEKFIDDRRFSMAYAKDKMRLSKWGSVKVRSSLMHLGIENSLIDEAVSEAAGSIENHNLNDLIEKKLASLLKNTDMRSLDYEQKRKLYAKLVRFAIGRGYQYNDIKAELSNVLFLKSVIFH